MTDYSCSCKQPKCKQCGQCARCHWAAWCRLSGKAKKALTIACLSLFFVVRPVDVLWCDYLFTALGAWSEDNPTGVTVEEWPYAVRALCL